MEIYLIRHTTPVLTPGLIYGRTEVVLADTFQEEMEMLRAGIPDDFEKIYSSPSLRCTNLAKNLASDFVIDERLLELNFGDWEGKTWNSVDQKNLHTWMEDFVNVCIPGGESMLLMHDRINHFLIEILKKPEKKIAVITHAGVIRIMRAIVEKIPLRLIFEIKVAYGEVVRLNI